MVQYDHIQSMKWYNDLIQGKWHDWQSFCPIIIRGREAPYRVQGGWNMETKFIQMRKDSGEFTREEEAGLRQAAEILKEGGLVAFPTETVYGLGGDALNAASSEKIYAAKGRPSDNPLIVHITKMEALPFLVREVPKAAYKLAARYWPGPLTMIFNKSKNVSTHGYSYPKMTLRSKWRLPMCWYFSRAVTVRRYL